MERTLTQVEWLRYHFTGFGSRHRTYGWWFYCSLNYYSCGIQILTQRYSLDLESDCNSSVLFKPLWYRFICSPNGWEWKFVLEFGGFCQLDNRISEDCGLYTYCHGYEASTSQMAPSSNRIDCNKSQNQETKMSKAFVGRGSLGTETDSKIRNLSHISIDFVALEYGLLQREDQRRYLSTLGKPGVASLYHSNVFDITPTARNLFGARLAWDGVLWLIFRSNFVTELKIQS